MCSLVAYKPGFVLPARLNLSCKNEGRIMTKRKRVCHYATKVGRGIVFPGC